MRLLVALLSCAALNPSARQLAPRCAAPSARRAADARGHAAMAALPPDPPPRPQPELAWTWETSTNDRGLPLNSPDLRDRRANWLRDLLAIGKSRVLRNIAERLFGTTVWSVLVAALFAADRELPFASHALWNIGPLPSWPHEAVASFLSILLVFRTDQAHDRFWSGRELWADAHSASRSISMLVLAHFPPGPARDSLLAHAATFTVALKQHLRGNRNATELAETWESYLEPWREDRSAHAAARRLRAVSVAQHMPSSTLAAMSSQIGALLWPDAPRSAESRAHDPSGQRQAALWTELSGHVEALVHVTSACERLKQTPIPWSYARHTSRFCTLFLLTLPFVLLHDCPLPMVPLVELGMGYVLFSLEEIGHVIEEPFSLAFDARVMSADPPSDAGGLEAISSAGARALVGAVDALISAIAPVLGYSESARETRRRLTALEVLPISKYAAIIQLEIALLAANDAQALADERAAAPPAGRAAVARLVALARGGRESHAAHASPAPTTEVDGVEVVAVDGEVARYHAIAVRAARRIEQLSGERIVGLQTV